ncbi:N-acetylmuramoyl-L-alanine amidase [Streptococcus sp. HMSC061D10]|uniref:N-acetylmuramoyl-L-alanine amidase n=1 Tax=Streptococcus sp. HMSC061D10 TaxID=1715207 RepID=UPI0008AE89FE|nr:N-acetylmuramoyl-L-alanine amidase [Streptococcus sp. HMSC061D10]OFN82635.1 N-acetylmuramoyl-L-alanine amidase [Streptococcus sp. HMSC061D10]
MKKTLLASAITLSVFGLTTNLSYAEENKVQSTPVETTHSETSADKVEKNSLPAKEAEPSTEANANQTTNPAKKEEDKAPEVQKEGWVLEENHWRFYENNAPVLNWKKIHGKWYYFNKDGIMLSDTIFDGYILTSSGAMVDSGWIKLQEKWYYANAYGKISQQKWEKIGGVWYYFDQDGVMLSNTIFDDYLFTNSGAMAESSWVKQDGQWYYALASGKLIKNKWDKISGTWYYFNKDATMASNQWQGSYYLKVSGAMAEKEWIFDKNYDSWFYLKSGGAYAAREWIGSYYLKAGGYMAKSEWIDDSYYKARYYVDENGVYVTGTHKIDGQTHQFQSNGKWIGETSVSRGFEKGKYNNIIFLDPGHGGKDPGAVYYNTNEKDLTMLVYKKLRKELEGLGYTVLSSRDSDVFVDYVTERSRMVNKTDSDIFISIHFNASGNPASNTAGIQTYSYEADSSYPSKINQYWHNHPDRISESNRLAADIHSSLLAETGAKDAGRLRRSFAVLRETNKPAVLLELGYIDNFNENQQVRSDAYQNRLVAGIVKGIQKYYAGQ